jgi:putative hydrolase of the HAD superfamily
MAKYLIWDFDDTLGHRAEGKWTASLVKVLQIERPDFPVQAEAIRPHMQSGFPWMSPDAPHTHITSADAWWESLHPLFARTFRSIGFPSDEADYLAREVRHVYADPSAWRLFDDTQPTLRELADSGWRHCMLSNHVPELPLILSHLGILEEFAAVVNSAEIGYEKPHPQAFKRVLDLLREPEAVWMIGDSYEMDIAGARALGIPGILVRKTHPQAEHCCADLLGVIGILSGADGVSNRCAAGNIGGITPPG